MDEHHIVSAFDRDLEAIQALVMKMGGMVETAIIDAATALETRDLELAERVRAADRAVDDLEEDVHQECARVIALRAPTAGDLRTILTVIKIGSNLERCGDYAKNMAKRVQVLAECPPMSGPTSSIRRMSHEARLMLKDALDAYIRRDVELAQQVILRDQEIDQMYTALFRELLTHMMEDPRHITPCMHLHFIAKNVERTGDHVTSIAEQVVYLVTGHMPDESRPKNDRTAFMAGDV